MGTACSSIGGQTVQETATRPKHNSVPAASATAKASNPTAAAARPSSIPSPSAAAAGAHHSSRDSGRGDKENENGLPSNVVVAQLSTDKPVSSPVGEALPWTVAKATISMVHRAERRADLLAAIVIQRWFRARRARRMFLNKLYWRIFSKIEYKTEQDHLQLLQFYMRMMAMNSLRPQPNNTINYTRQLASGGHMLDEALFFSRPHPPIDTSPAAAETFLADCRKNRPLQFSYVQALLDEAFVYLKDLDNVSRISAPPKGAVTIIGDLHGQLPDLLHIFDTNGLPSSQRPYVFNGDLVDRGQDSAEVFCIVLHFMLAYPGSVLINRGNHEDLLMNKKYGFMKELERKFPGNLNQIAACFGAVFLALPLATVVAERIFIVHAGISANTSLSVIERLDRLRYSSLQLLAVHGAVLEGPAAEEAEQAVDLVWSDPRPNVKGSEPNTVRGGGSLWGPSATKTFLKTLNFKLIVRSHECKQEGFEYCHDSQVLTVFSASHYYTNGSNKGAYLHIDDSAGVTIYPFELTSAKKMSSQARLREVEAAAMSAVMSQALLHKQELEEEFANSDGKQSGRLNVLVWAQIMDRVVRIDGIPWQSCRSRLAVMDMGMVNYSRTLQMYENCCEAPRVREKDDGARFYSNLDQLESVFRLIDADNSGFLTTDELATAVSLLSQGQERRPSLTEAQAGSLLKLMDLDHDGQITFNEFVECYRLVQRGAK
eukprot:m.193199 g.193199  ORF g.193199 m.193199 type:complete len:714 (-) comp17595_c0_seq1:1752-3893(-)